MVGITAWGALHGEELSDWSARRELPERKHLKLMTRPVRLGVAAVGRALSARPGWEDVPPERRGLFVGAVPRGAADDLGPALEIARDGQALDLRRFGEQGLPRLHPLWLVKGLSNNIPGYACAYWDIRGVTTNRCEGRVGGLAAIVEAAHAVEAGHVDLAIAGGGDIHLAFGLEGPQVQGEGAAFIVLERARGRILREAEIRLQGVEDAGWTRDVGAATGPLAVVDALEGEDAFRVAVCDAQVGLSARISVSARAR